MEIYKRDAVIMANARRLIKKNKSMLNWQLYKELFGTGSTTARMCCINNLGLDPDSNETSYNNMMKYIETIN